MKCPFCNYDDTQVKDSRTSSSRYTIRRRRYCPSCSIKFTTIEKVHFREIYVIKKSGIRKNFDINKIKQAVQTATRKRNISIVELDKLINNVVNEIEKSKLKEISSSRIGEILMEELLKLDLVAYVRFASVYKNFKSTADFIEFISRIKQP